MNAPAVIANRDLHTLLPAENLSIQETTQRTPLAILSSLIRDVIWEWDATRDLFQVSDRWKEIVGCPMQIDQTIIAWRELVHPSDLKSFDLALGRLRAGGEFRCDHRIRHVDGYYRDVEARGHWIEPGKRAIGTIRDTTRQSLVERKLLFETYHDCDTGLPNRTSIAASIERAIDQKRLNSAYRFTVLVLNIDRLSHVSDGHGLAASNQLLVALAARLRASLRPQDVLARLSGDAFAVLLDDVNGYQMSQKISRRIQGSLGEPIELGADQLYASVSIGMADGGEDARSADELLQRAQAAANHAGSSGPAGSEFFAGTMLHRKRDLIRRETQLRRALDQGDFSLRYQPIIDLGTGHIVALEALARWYHPTDGPIDPAQFIALAEETGLILSLGQWVCREACRQLARWRDRYPFRCLNMNVNLSRRQMADADLLDWTGSLTRELGLAPGALRLEITESLVMEDVAATAALCQQLRDRGIEMHIDDFGTGYSSLASLPLLPVRALKIDRSFVSRMHKCDKTRRIVETIVTLAHGLDMDVTAEGIETAKQRDDLRSMGCRFGQGFLFAPPLTAQELENRLAGK